MSKREKMTFGSHRGILWTIGLAFVCSSCVTVRLNEEITSYRSTVEALEGKLVRNANDADALRDLGVIYVQTRLYPRAEGYLRKAVAIEPDDPKALFYLGLSCEFQHKRDTALNIYVRYTNLSTPNPYRKLMEGRYGQLTRDAIREQFQALIANENSLSDAVMSPSTVAVYPLVYQGTDARYGALGKGLSEMMLIDLSQVKSIKLVERVRLEALLNELKFSQSRLVDPATAPRLGRLLKAGRMISGSYNISRGSAIRLDVAVWDIADRRYPNGTSTSDSPENLFKMEKHLVFAIIEKMGITLTRQEQERIQYVPTKNLQAFIAYSLGLEKEDEHDFKAAAGYFNQAAGLDPGFTRAQTKKNEMEALSYGGGSTTEVYAMAQTFDPPIRPDAASGGSDLLIQRLRTLNESLGSGFLPGIDSRKPVEDAHGSGAPFGTLPEPPKPPNR